jgi:hypothetical protein
MHPSRCLDSDFKILEVSNGKEWHTLLSLWPSSQEGLHALLAQLSFMRINAPPFSTRMMGEIVHTWY